MRCQSSPARKWEVINKWKRMVCLISRNLLLIQKTSSTEAKTVKVNKLKNTTLCQELAAQSHMPRLMLMKILTRWPQARSRFSRSFWLKLNQLVQVALTRWLKLRIWNVLWILKYTWDPKPKCMSELTWSNMLTILNIWMEGKLFQRVHWPKLLKTRRNPSKKPLLFCRKMSIRSCNRRSLNVLTWTPPSWKTEKP